MATSNSFGLDERLYAALLAVRPGHTAADIGCDHGKLSIALVKSGRCTSVIASDLRPGPLQVARVNICKAGCQGAIQLRLGDGLSTLSPGEATDIILAGIGGQTICEILEQAPWVFAPGIRLVLVPATKHSILRLWLAEKGFALTADVLVSAAGRPYAVMTADYTGECRRLTGPECVMGLVKGQPGWQSYIRWQISKIVKYRKGLEAQSPEGAAVDELIAHLQARVEGEPET